MDKNLLRRVDLDQRYKFTQNFVKTQLCFTTKKYISMHIKYTFTPKVQYMYMYFNKISTYRKIYKSSSVGKNYYKIVAPSQLYACLRGWFVRR